MTIHKAAYPAAAQGGRLESGRNGSGFFLALFACAALSGCGSAPTRDGLRVERPTPVAKAPGTARQPRGGGYYLDDGPGDAPPANLDSIPEPLPQIEPLHRGAMKPYVVLGQTYTPMTTLGPYKARGVASWYGRRYHGKPTSTGEIYDMYAMTAAHPLLPLPSYARVTNVANGKSVVVRINDRGPFIDNRLIDLSYTAAYRLGVLAGGSALVEVESIIPGAELPPTMVAVAPRAAPMTRPQPATRDSTPGDSTQENDDPIAAIVMAPRERSSASTDASAFDEIAANAPASVEGPQPSDSARSRGIYLQLGAFGSRPNAESYLARMRAQLDWLAQRLQVTLRDGLYRVHAGPYSSTADAQSAAERIALKLGSKPVIVAR